MNKEDKKLLTIFGVLAALVVIVFIGSSIDAKKNIEVVAKHKEVLTSNTKQAIYIGRPTCSYCQMFEPVLQEMKESYNFDYYYINTDELTTSQIRGVLATLGIKEDEFGTPYIVFMEDGKMVSNHVGYTDARTFFDKLKQNGYAQGDYVAPETFINYVDYNDYKEIVESKERSILIVGQTTCSYCIQAKPILNSIAKENSDLVINYIEFNLLNSSDSAVVDEFISKNVNSEWGTPLTLIIEDGKVIDKLPGLTTKEAYLAFFEKNGMVK